MSEHSSKHGVLERMLDAFNRHDLDFVGETEVRDGLGARFQGIPDVRYGDGSHFVTGDRGVSEWTLTGTTVDDERLEVRGCDLWTFRGDKIVRKDSFWKIVER